jgi:hypothetical protein
MDLLSVLGAACWMQMVTVAYLSTSSAKVADVYHTMAM